MVFQEEFFEKVDFEKNQQTTKMHEKLPSWQRDNPSAVGQASDLMCLTLAYKWWVGDSSFALLKSKTFSPATKTGHEVL